jgi:hypothetical protein
LDVVVEGEQLSRSRIGGAWALAKSSPCSNTVRVIDGQVCSRGRRHSSLYFSIASPTTGS